MNSKLRQWILLFVVILVVAALFAACNRDKEEAAQPAPQQSSATNGGGEGSAAGGGLPASAMEIAAARELTPADIEAALKTYVPSGKWDEYMMFASGGHSGNLIVIGIPSMRILKQVAVFTPESWQGYGYGELGTEGVLDGGNVDGETIRMGDTHHPALSETDGDYDGQFVFINDKNSARVAVIDLHDFETKQILKDPNIISNHGSTFVTPNTEYVIQGTQYATPLGWDYAPIDE